ncbi:hypothetical protein GRI69_13710 [Erythrobacter vulgaris]|uniref:DUF11 domain-containing protein n=1 Tax=Qipengyuania vulgaris TaxID=291985 RepID=A0A844XU80_9SPHN|nr:hypothetical protein [Qipengyuania vulgaris]MXO49310.1 hypothetical protein [Qipengyuania vulgaris]
MVLGRNLSDLSAAFLGVLLLFVAIPAYAQDAPVSQTITNIAEAQWRASGVIETARSNEVRIAVASAQAAIGTYLPDIAGSTTLQFSPSLCGSSTLTPSTSVGAAAPSSYSVSPATSIRIGQTLFFDVSAPAANLSPSSRDSIEVVLTTPSGDEERLTVFETSENSGEFAGSIQTASIPPQPIAGDCILSLHSGENISVTYHDSRAALVVTAIVNVLNKTSGFVFDSQNGQIIDGARLTLVNAASGLPAEVFAEDGVTYWPSSVTSGQPVTDGAGRTYEMLPGEYRFPIVASGSFLVEVSPPSPYSGPSTVSEKELVAFTRPTGGVFVITEASYQSQFSVTSSAIPQFDIPLDRPLVNVSLDKSVSRQIALPGDVVFYSITVSNPDVMGSKRNVVITDTPSEWLRLRPDSIRVDGERAEERVSIAEDGKTLKVRFDEIAAGAGHRITYAMAVRADAPEGFAVNRASASDGRGAAVVASANLRISKETIGNKMVVMGRITSGSCNREGRRGIAGVRVMLEDGSFAVTDAEGRYHFEGIAPGTHVVQAQDQTLPISGQFVLCARSTANGGSANSRFVRGQGGSLVVADFHAELPYGWNDRADDQDDEVLGDAEASGAEIAWATVGDGPAGFIFPAVDHNPRAPAVRVAVRHEIGEQVELRANNELVDPLSFDGVTKASDGSYAISVWRGIPLKSERTRLIADVSNANGSSSNQFERIVHFSGAPSNVSLVADQSRLVADGTTKSVVAVRITDRKGQPVRSGVSGAVEINAPYESAEALEAMQLRQLGGLSGAKPTWTIRGDDGVALIELSPTLVSGQLDLDFTFTDGKITRREKIEAWVVPGDTDWTLVGLAEASLGARTIADNMEVNGSFDSDLGQEGRVAFYAKGKVLGKFLLTAAYDSAKQKDEQRFQGSIDPDAYYTVFADGSARRFDAASREKLYLRVETSTFYAIYGDFRTGFNQTNLARYDRAATGVKAEGRFGALHVQGFAADIETRFRRDEIQGNGLTGPYRLSSRAIVPNSETVALEIRDRFRSEIIVERRELTRFIDYDLDLLSGTIRFKEPVLSRDFDLNPQFIVIDYETQDPRSTGQLNAGVRSDVLVADGDLRLGSTFVTDEGDGARTEMLAVDVKARLGSSTELRSEAAASVKNGVVSAAWQVEAEHHTGDLDVIAFARTVEPDFGVGQQNGAEQGRRKMGVDARYSISETLGVTGSAWHDSSLTDDARRNAIQIQAGYREQSTSLRLGLAHFDDRYRDGTSGSSTVLEGGASHRLLDNRLEINASTSIALSATESIDLPTRHRVGARYSVAKDVRLIGTYEVAEGKAIDAETLQGGVEVSPWAGARATGMLGQQSISELGARSYAAFGLAQSFTLSSHLTLDGTIDVNRQLGGVDQSKVINPQHPVSSGGHLGQDGQLFEDFAAITLGASWRKDRWAANARGEHRDGEQSDRTGLTFGAIRQLGEGSVLGSGFTWTRAESNTGSESEIFDGSIAAAYRPESSDFGFLAKLEYRSDSVTGAIDGETGPSGRSALIVNGEAKSRRLIGSVSTNWSPSRNDIEEGRSMNRSEFGLFVGGRYNFDAIESLSIEGFSLLAGVDARIGIGERFEIGGLATVRSNLTDGYTSFSFGPELGFSPKNDVLLTVGYNLRGFRDEDFSAARNTDEGLYTSIRMKFDADTFSFLGIGR